MNYTDSLYTAILPYSQTNNVCYIAVLLCYLKPSD